MSERTPRPEMVGKMEQKERKTPRELVIEAIRKNPDDWNQWQVLADMLLEAGDERGELINLEHDLETKELTEEERKEKLARMKEIDSVENREKWLGDLKAIELSATDFTWHRGFVQGLDALGFENVRTLLERVKSEEVGALLSELDTTVTSHGLNNLLDSPACKDLKRWRTFGASGAVLADIQAIAAAENLRNLTSLDVRENNIGPEGVTAIANSENLRNLTSLDVAYNDIGPEGARAIAASENLKNLTSLIVGSNNIGPEGARAIANSENFRNLTSLDVRMNAIGFDGVIALASFENLRNLTSLDVRMNAIGPEGVIALANSENLKNLTSLDVAYNDIGPEGARAIAGSENLKNLTSLIVGSNNIGPEGVTAIANSENLRNLTSLDVSYNNIGPDGIAAIAASENSRQFVTLNLFGVGLNVTDFRPLLTSENFPALRMVRVSFRGEEDERAELLALAKERGIELKL